MRLVARDILDPRPTAEAGARPIAGAVNIPFPELSQRVVELPPRHVPVRVAGPADLNRETVEWFHAHQRAAVAIESLEPASPPACDSGPVPASPAPLADEIGRLWRPNSFLEESSTSLATGRALDLACGSGRNAVFLAAAGWRVAGVDILPDALDLARGLERRYAPTCEPIEWREVDLERDAAALGGPYDLITCFRFLHRPLLAAIHRHLRPGGTLVMETFTTFHRQCYGKPRSDAFLLRPGELPELLTGLTLLAYDEAWRDDAHTARVRAVALADPRRAQFD